MADSINRANGFLTGQQWRQIGALAVANVTSRIKRSVNVEDSAAKGYSPRGPVYLPNTGIRGRTKTSLRGRFVITSADRRKLKGAKGVHRTRSGKSTRFENYAAMKRALGKSGGRDLELSGQMLGSVAVIREEPSEITIGFTRPSESLKMEGNERWESMWGFSRRDEAAIAVRMEEFIGANLERLIR